MEEEQTTVADRNAANRGGGSRENTPRGADYMRVNCSAPRTAPEPRARPERFKSASSTNLTPLSSSSSSVSRRSLQKPAPRTPED
ncbi:hypothetical protein INR49_027658 [Caranx melampygus]|nr:hypothetical protein INR49_027658 [Caranx melampygus]